MITTADLNSRVENDLDEITLQRIIDANVQAINRGAGAAVAITEDRRPRNSQWVSIRRPAVTIDTVTERRRHSSAAVILAADDYRLVGKYRLLRLTDGTNGAAFWGHELLVTYTPEVDQDVRDRVTLDLSSVDIEFRAYDKEKSADWEGEQKKGWKSKRGELLRQVREGRSPIV